LVKKAKELRPEKQYGGKEKRRFEPRDSEAKSGNF
jgi:hypothetical protein